MKLLVDKKPESCKECLFYKEIESIDGVQKTSYGGGSGGSGGSGKLSFPEYALERSKTHKCIILNKKIPTDIANDVLLKDCPITECK